MHLNQIATHHPPCSPAFTLPHQNSEQSEVGASGPQESGAVVSLCPPGHALCQRRTECNPRGAGGQTCDAVPGHTHAITVSQAPPKTPPAAGTCFIF